jgi:hypothetical protein
LRTDSIGCVPFTPRFKNTSKNDYIWNFEQYIEHQCWLLRFLYLIPSPALLYLLVWNDGVSWHKIYGSVKPSSQIPLIGCVSEKGDSAADTSCRLQLKEKTNTLMSF